MLLLLHAILIYLFAISLGACAQVDSLLSTLAKMHPTTKFVRTHATDCLPGYPKHNVPTLLVYANGDIRGQLVGPLQVLPFGSATAATELGNALRNLGAIIDPSRELSEDSEDDNDSD
jgi:hypothetical protein